MFYAYLLASKPHGTLYVGLTSDLIERDNPHWIDLFPAYRRDPQAALSRAGMQTQGRRISV